MGCVFCNLLRLLEEAEGSKNALGDKSYMNEMAYDIASNHPDLVKQIDHYRDVLSLEKVKRDTNVVDVIWFHVNTGPSVKGGQLSKIMDQMSDPSQLVVGLVVTMTPGLPERRAFMGIGWGDDEAVDLKHIKDWGTPVSVGFLEDMVAKIKGEMSSVPIEEEQSEECPICSGTGQLRGTNCPRCAGHGTIVPEPEEEEPDGETKQD